MATGTLTCCTYHETGGAPRSSCGGDCAPAKHPLKSVTLTSTGAGHGRHAVVPTWDMAEAVLSLWASYATDSTSSVDCLVVWESGDSHSCTWGPHSQRLRDCVREYFEALAGQKPAKMHEDLREEFCSQNAHRRESARVALDTLDFGAGGQP